MGTDAAQAELPRSRFDAAITRCGRDEPWCVPMRDDDGGAADPAEGRGDRVTLVLLLGNRSAGRRESQGAAGDAGSGFYLLDCERPQAVIPLHDSMRVLLPRENVMRLLGDNPAGDGGCRHLPATPMGEVLRAHLVALAQYDPPLAASAARFCANATVNMALAFLAQFETTEPAPDSDALLFDEACRHIDAYLHDPHLTASGVAQALGCSRTRLYRVFAGREWSVAAYARDQRLRRSRRLLRDTRMSIGEVALRCGYGDLPAFGKAFKRRFDRSPGEWRRMATSSARPREGEGPGTGSA